MKLIAGKDLYLLTVIAFVQTARGLFSSRLTLLLAKAVSFLAYHLSRDKKRLSEKNISRAFEGKLSRARVAEIARSSFYEFWLETFALSNAGGSKTTAQSVLIDGLEHLWSSLRQQKGAILWESSHFGRRHAAKQILHRQGVAIEQVHARNHIAGFGAGTPTPSWISEHVIQRFFDSRERSFVKDIMYLTDANSVAVTRVLSNRLKNNAVVCISAQGGRGHKFIQVPLFGRAVWFPTGIVSLAKISGAPIMPLFCFGDGEGRTRLTILPPLQFPANLEREQAAEAVLLQFVQLLEAYVRKYPGQYRSWHYLWGQGSPGFRDGHCSDRQLVAPNSAG